MYKYRAMYDYVDFYGHHDAPEPARPAYFEVDGDLASVAGRAFDAEGTDNTRRSDESR